MVVNGLRKPDSVVVIQNKVKLFDRLGKNYGKTFIVLSFIGHLSEVNCYNLPFIGGKSR